MSSAGYFHPIVTKFGFSRQIFIKVTEIRPVGTTVIQADRQTDRAKLKGPFREYANAARNTSAEVAKS